MNVTLTQGTWTVDITSLLGCRQCNETLTDARIYNCDNCGTLFCEGCLDNLLTKDLPCSVCSCASMSRASRCKPLEKIVEMLPKRRCRHAGCEKYLNSTHSLQLHEENRCPRRPIFCRYCRQPVAMAEMVDHVNNLHHPQVGIFGDKLLFAICREPGEVWSCYRKVTMADGQGEEVVSFGVHVNFLAQPSPSMVAWVSQDDPPLRGTEGRYGFRLAISTTDGSGDLVSASGPCTPVFVNPEDDTFPMLYANEYVLQSARNRDHFVLQITVVKCRTCCSECSECVWGQ